MFWEPPTKRINRANIMAFMDFINKENGKGFESYDDPFLWSVNSISDFWSAFLRTSKKS